MWAEIAAGAGLISAGARVISIATGEDKKRRDESMERAVEKHFKDEDKR